MNGRSRLSDEVLARYTNDTQPPYHCKLERECHHLPFDSVMGVKMHFIRTHTNKNWDSSGNLRRGNASSTNGRRRATTNGRRAIKPGKGYRKYPAPRGDIQCPWCDTLPYSGPGRLAQHVKIEHPEHWRDNIYASLPANFNYGDGPLSPEHRQALIQMSMYARKAYNQMHPRAGKRRLGLTRVSGRQMVAEVAERKPRTVEQIFGRSEDAQDEKRVVRVCPHCAQNLDDIRDRLGGKKLAFCPVDGVDIEVVEEAINK